MSDHASYHDDALTSRSLRSRVNAPSSLEYPGEYLGLLWAPVSQSDAEQMHAVLIACETSWLGSFFLTPERIGDWIERSSDPAENIETVTGKDREGVIQAIGTVALNPAAVSEIQAELVALIRPEWRGKGIGRSLLEWQDGRARQLIADMDADLPVSLRTMVRRDNLERRRLLAAGGFSPRLRVFHFVKPLGDDDVTRADDAAKRLADNNLHVRGISGSARDSVFRLDNRLAMTEPHREPVEQSWWDFQIAGVDTSSSIVVAGNDEVEAYALVQSDPRRSRAYVMRYGVERALQSTTTEQDMLDVLAGRMATAGFEEMVVGAPENAQAIHYLPESRFLEETSSILYTIDL